MADPLKEDKGKGSTDMFLFQVLSCFAGSVFYRLRFIFRYF